MKPGLPFNLLNLVKRDVHDGDLAEETNANPISRDASVKDDSPRSVGEKHDAGSYCEDKRSDEPIAIHFGDGIGQTLDRPPNGVRLSCGAELELSQTEDYLRNRGAGSFRRLLGGRPTGLSTHPAAHPSPRENSSENRKHDGANVCALTARSGVSQGACDREKAHRIEDEEGAQSEEDHSKSAHIDFKKGRLTDRA